MSSKVRNVHLGKTAELHIICASDEKVSEDIVVLIVSVSIKQRHKEEVGLSINEKKRFKIETYFVNHLNRNFQGPGQRHQAEENYSYENKQQSTTFSLDT